MLLKQPGLKSCKSATSLSIQLLSSHVPERGRGFIIIVIGLSRRLHPFLGEYRKTYEDFCPRKRNGGDRSVNLGSGLL